MYSFLYVWIPSSTLLSNSTICLVSVRWQVLLQVCENLMIKRGHLCSVKINSYRWKLVMILELGYCYYQRQNEISGTNVFEDSIIY